MIDRLSVIIPALNEEKYLPLLLKSLNKQKFKGSLQIIIVDGYSVDNTVKIAREFRKCFKDFKVIKANRGISEQRNRGALEANYEHLLFLDADTVLPENILNNISEKSGNISNFVHTVILHPYHNGGISVFNHVLIKYIQVIINKFEPILPGSFILTTKANHFKINGFTESTIAGEDVDYGRKSVKSGAEYRLFSDLFIYVSARRAEKSGTISVLLTWLKIYIYVKLFGLSGAQRNFKYLYGNHL